MPTVVVRHLPKEAGNGPIFQNHSKLLPTRRKISAAKVFPSTCCGYGRQLMIERSWVRIQAPYTGWIWHFSHLFVTNNCNVCLKRPKINEKEAGVGPFFNKEYFLPHVVVRRHCIDNETFPPPPHSQFFFGVQIRPLLFDRISVNLFLCNE